MLAIDQGETGQNIDAEVRRLTDLADEAPKNAGAQLAAAQVIAAAVDRRLVRGQWQAAMAAGLLELSVDDLVGLDATLDSDLRSEILGLSSAGMDYAKRASTLDESGGRTTAASAYYLCFHMSLVAWAEGTAAAVLQGRGPALAKLLKASAETDPLVSHAGALRVRGRFLDRAPWPYRDRDTAIQLLQRASLAAPIAVNYEFLGDALWSAGRKADAAEAWRAGRDAIRTIESGPEPGSAEQRDPWEQYRLRLLEARISAAERER